MKKITILLLFYAFTFNLPAQSFFKNTRLSLGFAAQAQDRRLFDFAGRADIIKREKSRLDYGYSVMFQKPVFTFRRFETAIGLGYLLSRHTFSRPFDHAFFLSGQIVDGKLRFFNYYQIHKAGIPVTGRWYIDKNKLFNVQLNALATVALNRNAKSGSDIFSHWEFTPYSLEINPGVGMKTGKSIEINLNYRILYVSKLDDVIFNSILFREDDPEFLKQKTDTYNPFKLWLSVGYVF